MDMFKTPENVNSGRIIFSTHLVRCRSHRNCQPCRYCVHGQVVRQETQVRNWCEAGILFSKCSNIHFLFVHFATYNLKQNLSSHVSSYFRSFMQWDSWNRSAHSFPFGLHAPDSPDHYSMRPLERKHRYPKRELKWLVQKYLQRHIPQKCVRFR